MSEYLKMPWSEEVTIENLKSAKEIIKNLVSNVNLDGMGEEDAEEVEFDFNRAIEALEKQIPKKPAIYTDTRPKLDWEGYADGSYAVDTYECSVCGCYISDKEDDEDYCYKPAYCPNCGQRIDWGDEE